MGKWDLLSVFVIFTLCPGPDYLSIGETFKASQLFLSGYFCCLSSSGLLPLPVSELSPWWLPPLVIIRRYEALPQFCFPSQFLILGCGRSQAELSQQSHFALQWRLF